MTDAEIVAALRARQVPTNITDADILLAINQVILFLRIEWPVDTYGTFTTVADQAVYDLFSATSVPATQQGVLPGGQMPIEIIGTSSCVADESDVFGIAPFLQGIGFQFAWGGYGNYSFATPGDLTLWETNWHSFVKRFGTLQWEQVSTVLGSPIRLIPCPKSANLTFIRYTKTRTDAELRDTNPYMFLLFVEAFVADSLANVMALTAGVKIGELDNRGQGHAHWVNTGRMKRDEAMALLFSYQTQMTSPAQRS